MVYHGLTLKQKKFADEYIISSNAEQAAIKAGYSEKYARGNAHKLVANSCIKKYIDERLAELESEKIADQKEILEILTEHVRRQSTEYNLDKSGKVVKTPTSVANSIKAAELLGKRYGMWTDKIENTTEVVVIHDDI